MNFYFFCDFLYRNKIVAARAEIETVILGQKWKKMPQCVLPLQGGCVIVVVLHVLHTGAIDTLAEFYVLKIGHI